jgi:hypothetical protein
VCCEMCVTFYVFVRSCVFSYKISCDGAIFFSLCRNTKMWWERWNLKALLKQLHLVFFFILCTAMNCVNVDFSFLPSNYGNSIDIYFYDLSDGQIKMYWQCTTEIRCVKNVLTMNKWNTATLCMEHHFANIKTTYSRVLKL